MKKTFTSIFFFSILLIIGCAEKPKSIGNGLPNNDGIFNIVDTTFTASGDTTYKVAFETGFGPSNLVGRLSPTEEVISLVNFIPGREIDSLRGAVIDTVNLILTVNYRYKPVTIPITFSVVEVQTPWSQASFTSDSVAALMLGSKVIGAFSDSMNFATQVIARLDTTEIRKWALSHSDTTAQDFYGFAVQSPIGITNSVIGFSTFSSSLTYAPQLFIRYTKNGRRDSLTFTSGEDTYATKYSGSTTFTSIIVRGAFGIRSKVHFNLSALADKPIVNNATLELTLDTLSSSIGGYSPDSVIALLGISNTILDRSDSTIYTYGFKKSTTAGQAPVYAFKLTNITDRWIRSVNPNYGLTLRWAAEYGSVEKAVFYSSAAPDVTNRPRLNITYSKK